MKLVNANSRINAGQFPAVFGLSADSPSAGCLCSCTAALLFLAVIFFAGCAMPVPLKGGRAHSQLSTSGVITNFSLEQGENAQQPTTQTQEQDVEETFVIPGGSLFELPRESFSLSAPIETATASNPAQAAAKNSAALERPGAHFILSEPMPVTRHAISKTGATLGAAQKDTSRELAAKFANMKPVQFVGIALLLGAGVLVYFGWYTPAMIAGGTGLGLILLAHSIVGNERIILILALAAAAIFAVLHAYNKGQLDRYLPDTLDKNKPNPPTPAPPTPPTPPTTQP